MLAGIDSVGIARYSGYKTFMLLLDAVDTMASYVVHSGLLYMYDYTLQINPSMKDMD
jgi:hypothetical protein